MNFLFLITARGGSKGVPGKNIRLLAGKPLICYAIDCARELANDKDICVSTDDEDIIKTANDYGLEVPFKRPAELAADNSSQYDVIKHAICFYSSRGIDYDAVVLLQPTSPFRKAIHVREALGLYDSQFDMVVSVKHTEGNPYYVLFEEGADGFLKKVLSGNFVRRQDCPEVWQLNGAIYIINVSSLQKYNSIGNFCKVKKYTMPKLSSVDIDDPLDWEFCEFLIERKLYE